MTALDKVLAALDAGLQSSDEHGYPGVPDDGSMCARCLREERPDEGDIGPLCRAFLLGDSDEDPSGWYPLTVEGDGTIHGYLTPQYAVAPPTELERRAAMYRRPIRVSRLDAEGRPTGDSNMLAGYAVHHRDGNPRNNDMVNMEIGPVAGTLTAMREAHDAYMAEREQAFQRLAEGLSVPPELLEASRGVYDWAREEGERVAADRQRNWQAEAWRYHRELGHVTVEDVQELQRRIEQRVMP